MKIALVYDRLNKIGGAEQVLCAFHELYPHAEWYTSVWDPVRAPFSRDWRVHTSWLSNISLVRRHHEWVAPLMPFIFESFDLSGYDLVISIGSAECKGVVTGTETVHIHYCLTPTRYLWSHREEYIQSNQFGLVHRLLRSIGRRLITVLAEWDRVAATRPDYMISISEHVKKRVQKYYKRDSDVIHPPVDTGKFRSKSPDHQMTSLPDNFYLIVSRLVPYKNIALAVQAFNASGRNLVIVGTGTEFNRLKRIAKSNVTLMGHLSDHEVVELYRRCRAYIQCNEEDFGIAMVEAQAAGKPVVAYGQGGAREIVTSATGVLYNEILVKSLNDAVDHVESAAYDERACRNNAARFDKVKWMHVMSERIRKYVNKK